MNPRVALVRCESYDLDRVRAAVGQALKLLGGMERFVQRGDRVLVRPNLIAPRPIEAAATTHPAVVEAVVRAAQEAGGGVIIGDCPGGLAEQADLDPNYRVSGLADVAERTGAELDRRPEPVEVEHPPGRYLKRAAVARAVIEADTVITVPKLKTHALTGLTGAVKLCFGAVPGRLKTGYHLRYPKVHDFSGALLDLHDLVGPRLTIMDAVVVMEGEGPTSGDPRHVGALLGSENSLACDVASARLVGLDPWEVSTTQVAIDQGRIGARFEDLDLTGESLSDLQIGDFRRTRTQFPSSWLYSWLVDLLGRWVSPHPTVGESCTGCGTCAQNCPAEAITIPRGEAHIDYGRCIHCFCCQELCPERAMTVRYPRLTRSWTQPQ